MTASERANDSKREQMAARDRANDSKSEPVTAPGVGS